MLQKPIFWYLQLSLFECPYSSHSLLIIPIYDTSIPINPLNQKERKKKHNEEKSQLLQPIIYLIWMGEIEVYSDTITYSLKLQVLT